MPLTTVDQGLLSTNAQYTGFKNRIINGNMVIAQRTAGAPVTAAQQTTTYCVDRFGIYKDNAGATITMQQSSTAPVDFVNSLLTTVTVGNTISAGSEMQLRHSIEGYNIADLNWGTANAKPIVISFWVRSSLTGTFAIALQSVNTLAAYVTTYTINAANTWEQKTISIPGPTSGTFNTTNSIGVTVIWDLGGGSNFNATANSWTTGNVYTTAGTTKLTATTGATMFLTGVQLEKGQTATSFDVRPYGTELALCQRYCYAQRSTGNVYYSFGVSSSNGTTPIAYIKFPMTMRAVPTLTASAGSTFLFGNGSPNTILIDQSSEDNSWIFGSGGTGSTAGFSGRFLANNTTSAFLIWSSEL